MSAAPTMDFADTSTAATTVWLAQLARHEDAINEGRRMKAYRVEARRVDSDGVVSLDADAAADAAFRDFAGDLAAWRAHADECRAMIGVLAAALDHIAAIPTEDMGAYQRACGLWCRLRHGKGSSVRPLPPAPPWRDWAWPVSLAWHQTDGYGMHLPVCRQRYRLLAAPARRAVLEEWGIASDIDVLREIYPTAARDALDRRANTLGASLYWSLMGPGSKRFSR